MGAEMAKRLGKSEKAFKESRKYIPGGVNSPVRAYGAVGGTPPFIARGKGAKIWDIDGREYIDYVGSWGPLILGHAHPAIVKAAQKSVEKGMTFGAPTLGETELACLIVKAFPSMDMVRLVSSGTEACMSAIRLARAYTRRDYLVKFEGCYHGHFDGLLVKAGSGAATFGSPTSPGVPKSYASKTFVLPYNDISALKKLCEASSAEIACVIVEPIAGNMGVVPPSAGFLEELREVTRKHGILLIFDEVISGFRVAYGGAQSLYGIAPDLTVLGKIVGGGFPLAAYGGRREIMTMLSPLGGVYQAGTLSGNPVAVAAGIETLRRLKGKQNYLQLEKMAKALEDGIVAAAQGCGLLLRVNRVGSMLTLFFTGSPVVNYRDACRCDTVKYARFFWEMNKAGFYFAPSQFEAAFVSLAHTTSDISATVSACADALKKL